MHSRYAPGVKVKRRRIWFDGQIAGTRAVEFQMPSLPYTKADDRVGESAIVITVLLTGAFSERFEGARQHDEADDFINEQYLKWLQSEQDRLLATPPPFVKARRALVDESCPQDTGLIRAFFKSGYAISQGVGFAPGFLKMHVQTSNGRYKASIWKIDPSCEIEKLSHWSIVEPEFSDALIDAGVLEKNRQRLSATAFMVLCTKRQHDVSRAFGQNSHHGTAHLAALRWLGENLDVDLPNDLP